MKWKVSFAEVVTLEQRPDWQEEVRQMSMVAEHPKAGAAGAAPKGDSRL